MVKLNPRLLSLLKIVRSRISCEPGETANRETRVSRLCRSTLSGLGKDTTCYCWCDSRGFMSPLSNHICLHDKDLFINLWIDASQKIKIPAWYCLEDEVVVFFDSHFTFESWFRWHRLILTVESTRGIRTLVVVYCWKKCSHGDAEMVSLS